MPVVLNEELLSDWNNYETDIKYLQEQLNLDINNINYHRVDVAVNNPKNNNDNLYKEYSELPF
jgi:putative SOS response-associated peptidase YedK